MFRPVRKRILRIGILILVVSVILFSYSIYSIESGVITHRNLELPFGSSQEISIVERNVSAGNDLQYSISSHNGSDLNVSAYMISPSGSHIGSLSIRNASTGSTIIVAGVAGNWTLVIVNNDPQIQFIDVTISNVGYLSLLGAVFGLVLLIVGIAVIGIHSYIRYMEKRREKLRGFSQ